MNSIKHTGETVMGYLSKIKKNNEFKEHKDHNEHDITIDTDNLSDISSITFSDKKSRFTRLTSIPLFRKKGKDTSKVRGDIKDTPIPKPRSTVSNVNEPRTSAASYKSNRSNESVKSTVTSKNTSIDTTPVSTVTSKVIQLAVPYVEEYIVAEQCDIDAIPKCPPLVVNKPLADLMEQSEKLNEHIHLLDRKISQLHEQFYNVADNINEHTNINTDTFEALLEMSEQMLLKKIIHAKEVHMYYLLNLSAELKHQAFTDAELKELLSIATTHALTNDLQICDTLLTSETRKSLVDRLYNYSLKLDAAIQDETNANMEILPIIDDYKKTRANRLLTISTQTPCIDSLKMNKSLDQVKFRKPYQKPLSQELVVSGEVAI